MMYSEFVEGTGCRDNEYNHKVYRDLEIMYMNSDMSKEEIYEYGKKLVDNSKSEEQIMFEKGIREQIDEYKTVIKQNKEDIKTYEMMLKSEDDPAWIKEWKMRIKYRKDVNREYRNKIKWLKWVIE